MVVAIAALMLLVAWRSQWSRSGEFIPPERLGDAALVEMTDLERPEDHPLTLALLLMAGEGADATFMGYWMAAGPGMRLAFVSCFAPSFVDEARDTLYLGESFFRDEAHRTFGMAACHS